MLIMQVTCEQFVYLPLTSLKVGDSVECSILTYRVHFEEIKCDHYLIYGNKRSKIFEEPVVGVYAL